MATRAPARVQTNLVGRIITKAESIPVGSYRWPVDDPIIFVPTFPAEHKAEIVAVYTDNDGELKLTCRTPIKGLLFTIPATDNGHTVSDR